MMIETRLEQTQTKKRTVFTIIMEQLLRSQIYIFFPNFHGAFFLLQLIWNIPQQISSKPQTPEAQHQPHRHRNLQSKNQPNKY